MSVTKRDQILAEAERLFGQNGFAATRLSGIAKAVGLGNAGLLHHFPSKSAIYRAVLDGIAADFEARYAVADPSVYESVKLDELIEGLLALYRDRPNGMAIIVHEFLDRSGRIDDAEFLPLAGVVQYTAALLEAGQQTGAIRSGDPVAMTAAFHGALIVGCLGRSVYERTGGEGSASDWEAELARSALASVLAS